MKKLIALQQPKTKHQTRIAKGPAGELSQLAILFSSILSSPISVFQIPPSTLQTSVPINYFAKT